MPPLRKKSYIISYSSFDISQALFRKKRIRLQFFSRGNNEVKIVICKIKIDFVSTKQGLLIKGQEYFTLKLDFDGSVD